MLVAVPMFTACDTNDTEEKDLATKVSTYAELITAIENATENDIISLTQNIAIDDIIVVNKKLTLDLNGKTISYEKATDLFNESVDKWSLISVTRNGDLTITGNGKLKAKENDTYAVDLVNGGKCTIKNGEFIGNISAVYVYQGNLIIEGGKFSIQQLSDKADERFTINCYDSNFENETATVAIRGGSFKNFNPANNLAEGPNTNFVQNGYTVTGPTDTYFTVSPTPAT